MIPTTPNQHQTGATVHTDPIQHPRGQRPRRRSRNRRSRNRHSRNQRGEGVISTAIAVLIVALLGVALWTGFRIIVQDATDRTSAEIQQISGTP